MPKKKLTPNQVEYKKQQKRLRAIELKYQRSLGITDVTSVVPQMPSIVRKIDIERLRKIKPAEMHSMIDQAIQSQSTNVSDSTLPTPPHTDLFFDNETNQLVDLETSEVLQTKDYPEFSSLVMQNLENSLSSATNAEVADVVKRTLAEEVSDNGIEEVAQRLQDAGTFPVNLALEITDDSDGERVISNALQLITIIRGGNVHSSDQWRLNEAFTQDTANVAQQYRDYAPGEYREEYHVRKRAAKSNSRRKKRGRL